MGLDFATGLDGRLWMIRMLTSDDVRALVMKRLEGKTQKELADELGISAAYLNDYIHFRRDPGVRLLNALGLRRVVMYERIK